MDNKVASIFQVLVGSTFILIAMLVDVAPLGGLAILPLIGIVPILFGLYGVQSPLCKIVTRSVNAIRKHSENKVTPTAA